MDRSYKTRLVAGAATLAIAAAALPGAALAQDELNVLVEGGGKQLQQAIADKFTAETGVKVNMVEQPYSGVFDKLSAA